VFITVRTIQKLCLTHLSEAWVMAGWLLGSWVRIPLKAWMFVPCLSVLCCPVQVEALRRDDYSSYHMSNIV
jgi:hypothetical protein